MPICCLAKGAPCAPAVSYCCHARLGWGILGASKSASQSHSRPFLTFLVQHCRVTASQQNDIECPFGQGALKLERHTCKAVK